MSGSLPQRHWRTDRTQFESVIDLAYELMPNASSLRAHRVAHALTLLPAGGRALLDPRSLAGHESQWIRSAAAALWCTADGRGAQLGYRLAADPYRHVRRAMASRLPGLPEYKDLQARHGMTSGGRSVPFCTRQAEKGHLVHQAWLADKNLLSGNAAIHEIPGSGYPVCSSSRALTQAGDSFPLLRTVQQARSIASDRARSSLALMCVTPGGDTCGQGPDRACA